MDEDMLATLLLVMRVTALPEWKQCSIHITNIPNADFTWDRITSELTNCDENDPELKRRSRPANSNSRESALVAASSGSHDVVCLL